MAHGTSLHGRCWAPIAGHLGPGLRALALDMRGHGRSGPSPDGAYPWERFALDLLATVDTLGLAEAGGSPVGAGHSAGATAFLLAEAMRPGTFGRLWLWEPVLRAPGSDLRSGRSAELAARARKRKAHFASPAQARHYLQGRGMFAEMGGEALDAFLQGAFVPDGGGGLELACAPETEAKVYEAAPQLRLWDTLGSVACPVRLLGGAESPAVPPRELALLAERLPRATTSLWPGLGHFGPFGDPAAAGADLSQWAGAALDAGPA